MRTTKVFSVEDGTLQMINNIVVLWEDAVNDEIPIATTPSNVVTNNVDTLPSTLIRTPKSDEELAEEMYKDYEFSQIKTRGIFHEDRLRELDKSTFLAGRKSFGDKKFHLSEKELEKLICDSREEYFPCHDDDRNYMSSPSELIASLTPPPIYPTSITVQHDGSNYLWETLKAEY